jgi:polyhydroxyalkanoate synthesis regulator phasin
MAREFANQDPNLPPGVSASHPHFWDSDYESEIDIDYANEVLSWLEEAENSVEEAIKLFVALGEINKESAKKDMEIVKHISNIKAELKDAIDEEERKINGEEDDYDADFAYECWREDNI